MYETRKNRYSKCVSLCFIFLKPSDNSSLLFRLFTEKEPVMETKAVSVSVHEHKAALLIHPDLSDYQWAEPKPFSSFPLVLLILAALSASKRGSSI